MGCWSYAFLRHFPVWEDLQGLTTRAFSLERDLTDERYILIKSFFIRKTNTRVRPGPPSRIQKLGPNHRGICLVTHTEPHSDPAQLRDLCPPDRRTAGLLRTPGRPALRLSQVTYHRSTGPPPAACRDACWGLSTQSWWGDPASPQTSCLSLYLMEHSMEAQKPHAGPQDAPRSGKCAPKKAQAPAG